MNYNFSYWEYESFLKDIDVAIVGSGIVGLSAAIHLKKENPKLKVVVLERGPLPIGASTRNAGFACIGSMTEILDDLKTQNEEKVFSLVKKRYDGLNLLRATLGDQNIKYQPCGGYEIFSHSENEDYEECLDYMSPFNIKLKDITNHPTTFKTANKESIDHTLHSINHLIVNEVEGAIHTGEMMKSWIKLAKEIGVETLCGVNVSAIQDDYDQVQIELNNQSVINAKRVIIATNGLAKNLSKNIKIEPARNQVLLTSVIPNLKLNGTFHYQKGYVYFRNIDNRILLGGFRHLDLEGEATSNFGNTKLIQNALTGFLKDVILKDQSFEIDYQWSGIVGVGKSKDPVIENVSKNCVAAVRLGGMGVAIGSIIGKEAADLLQGK